MIKFPLPFIFLFSFKLYAIPASIDNGTYYAYWVYGDEKEYTKYPVLVNDPQSINGRFYMVNDIKSQSNDEVYMEVKNEKIYFFYKHDEIEGGPTVGWSHADKFNDGLRINNSVVKNIYDGDSDRKDARYFVGDKFDDDPIVLKEKEFIPLTKINNSTYKIDCSSYLDINQKIGGDVYAKSDSSQNYSGYVFLNYDGICGVLLKKNVPAQVKSGWILLKKIN